MRKRIIVRRKLNSLSRRLRWERALARPFQAWVSPTTRCNLRCRTCSKFDGSMGKFRDMSEETYAVIQREIMPYLGEVTLTGAGEPMMAPILPKMLDDCERYQVRPKLITNGTVNDETLLRRLVRMGSELVVSVDGADEETLKYVRPGLKFSDFCETLENIARLKKELKTPGFDYIFNIVMLRRNIDQLEQIVDWAARLNVGCIFFSNFRAIDHPDKTFAEESLEKHPGIVSPVLDSAIRKCESLGIHSVRPQFTSDGDAATKKSKNGRLLNCAAPWWGLMIEADGSIFPCCQWWPPIGNIHDKPFAQIWNGPEFREIRRSVNALPLPPSCQQCILDARRF